LQNGNIPAASRNSLLFRPKLAGMLPIPGGSAMRKRGRVSSAATGVAPVRISAKERPAPPAGLTARERRQWNEITGALRPDWFDTAVETGLRKDLDRIPAEIVADQAVRLLKTDQLFTTGRELEMASYHAALPSFDGLGVQTKSMLGACWIMRE
jgi:hypothetical protein